MKQDRKGQQAKRDEERLYRTLITTVNPSCYLQGKCRGYADLSIVTVVGTRLPFSQTIFSDQHIHGDVELLRVYSLQSCSLKTDAYAPHGFSCCRERSIVEAAPITKPVELGIKSDQRHNERIWFNDFGLHWMWDAIHTSLHCASRCPYSELKRSAPGQNYGKGYNVTTAGKLFHQGQHVDLAAKRNIERNDSGEIRRLGKVQLVQNRRALQAMILGRHCSSSTKQFESLGFPPRRHIKMFRRFYVAHRSASQETAKGACSSSSECMANSALLLSSCKRWSPEIDASPESAYATAAPISAGMMKVCPSVASATKTAAARGVLYAATMNEAIPTAA